MAPYDYVKTTREEAGPVATGGVSRFRRNMKIYTKLNVWVYRLSGGRLMNSAMGGYPICLVEFEGHKSGTRRYIPLIDVPYGQSRLLVGSQAGLDRDPVWVRSLEANPEIWIQANGSRGRYRARRVGDEEKSQLWPHLCSVYPDYDSYQARTDRNIPVFACESTEANSTPAGTD